MGGGEDITYNNPGQIDLASSNPEQYAELQRIRALQDQFHNDSQNYLDPSRYDARMHEAMNTANTGIQNRFAQFGLAGSSAALGAQNESDRQLGMQWDDRRLNDMLRSLQAESSLSGQASGLIGGIQGQYGQTQDKVIQAQLSQAQQEQQLWSSIIGAGATIGATALAGPIGGAAAGSMAGSMSPMSSGGGESMAGYYMGGPNAWMNNNSMYGYGTPGQYGWGG